MLQARLFIVLTAILAILSLGGFNAATLITLHCHFLADGHAIVHSHSLPDNNRRTPHNHTQREYAELDAACLLLDTMVVEAVLDSEVAFCSCGKITPDSVFLPPSDLVRQTSARSPPSLYFS